MVPNDEKAMRTAIEQWLAARANFRRRIGDYVTEYSAADLRLVAAFAADWNAEAPTLFAKAYKSFKAILIADANEQRARICDQA